VSWKGRSEGEAGLKTLQPAKHCRQAEPAGLALAVAVHALSLELLLGPRWLEKFLQRSVVREDSIDC